MVSLIDLPPQRVSAVVRVWCPRVRALHGIHPASIADELGLQERTVCMIQRKLGLRACRGRGSENS